MSLLFKRLLFYFLLFEFNVWAFMIIVISFVFVLWSLRVQFI